MIRRGGRLLASGEMNMWPIGPLMREHRIIERMVALMRREADRLKSGGMLEPVFIDRVAGFIKNYADRCHHGKEEDILFRDLKAKGLSADLAQIMNELIEEHKVGRQMTRELLSAKEHCMADKSGSPQEVVARLQALTDFYPKHIEKEDKRFFYPCMELFDRMAKDAMLEEFWKFDRMLVHEIYENVVTDLEAGGGG